MQTVFQLHNCVFIYYNHEPSIDKNSSYYYYY